MYTISGLLLSPRKLHLEWGERAHTDFFGGWNI